MLMQDHDVADSVCKGGVDDCTFWESLLMQLLFCRVNSMKGHQQNVHVSGHTLLLLLACGLVHCGKHTTSIAVP